MRIRSLGLPEATDTQSSTSNDMPRDASYRLSFSLPTWGGGAGAWVAWGTHSEPALLLRGPPGALSGPKSIAPAPTCCPCPIRTHSRHQRGTATLSQRTHPSSLSPHTTTSVPHRPHAHPRTSIHHIHHVLYGQARLCDICGQDDLAGASWRHPECLALVTAGSGSGWSLRVGEVCLIGCRDQQWQGSRRAGAGRPCTPRGPPPPPCLGGAVECKGMWE